MFYASPPSYYYALQVAWIERAIFGISPGLAGIFTALYYQSCTGSTSSSKIALHCTGPYTRILCCSKYSSNAVKNGSTPLIQAALFGQDLAVELLLSQAEIQVNLQDRYGAAIWHAACQGHASTLQKLPEAPQIRVNDFDIKYRLTPLAVAVAEGYEATVKLLLKDHHVNVNSVHRTKRTLIFCAISRGYRGIFKLLLLHQQTDVNFRDSKGRTPLLYAMYKKPSMASLLLYDPRILIDFQDYTGCTAVWIRVKKNKQQFVEHLLRRGADPNIADCTRLTPLSLASKSGSIDILQLLLANGAHLHSRDEQGKTPLHHAALFGRDKLF